jgi:hypothetical protein
MIAPPEEPQVAIAAGLLAIGASMRARRNACAALLLDLDARIQRGSRTPLLRLRASTRKRDVQCRASGMEPISLTIREQLGCSNSPTNRVAQAGPSRC